MKFVFRVKIYQCSLIKNTQNILQIKDPVKYFTSLESQTIKLNSGAVNSVFLSI